MMQSGVPGGGVDRRTQHALAVAIATGFPIEIGKIDRRRRKLWAKSQRGLVLGFGLREKAAPRIEMSERRTRFRPVGIETLGGDEFGGRAVKTFAVGDRLVSRRHGGEQCDGLDAHATNG